MHILYQLAKIFHIIGFVTAIGITLATFFSYNQFWKLYATNKEQGLASFRAFMFLQRVGMTGLMVTILGGLTMLFVADWSFLTLLWFRIKLILIILIFVNGFTLGRTSSLKLQTFIAEGQSDKGSQGALTSLKTRLCSFLIIQLLIYAIIIVLSVFRFT